MLHLLNTRRLKVIHENQGVNRMSDCFWIGVASTLVIEGVILALVAIYLNIKNRSQLVS